MWKPSRYLIVPAFSLANLKRIRKLFEDSIQLFLNSIEKFAISEECFDVRPYFESFVLDTVLRAFFATEVDSANDSTNPLVLNSRRIFMKDISIEQLLALFSPTLSKIFDFRVADRTAMDFMTKLIQKMIDERKQHNIKRNDLLQILLDSTDDSPKTSKISQYFDISFMIIQSKTKHSRHISIVFVKDLMIRKSLTTVSCFWSQDSIPFQVDS